MQKKRYALCGASTRGLYHFAHPLLGLNHHAGPNFDDRAELVGLLDIDSERMEAFCQTVKRQIPCYDASEMARMIEETRPDVVLVTTPDYSHAQYIIAAMELGCDVIVEKPMVIDSKQIKAVREAEERTGQKVTVALNYRYTPTHKALRRMIMAGKLGRITNIEFSYNLDIRHGSSYFYRWNRERAKSGGMSIHKCCHHFDLINWLIGDEPEWVFAFGALNYYGPDGALRPRDESGWPLGPAEEKRQCFIFQKHYAERFSPESDDIAGNVYPLPSSGQYPPDLRRYIYDAQIDIEDTYSMVTRYRGGASMAYSCCFCSPWEGYILGINGTGGRVEVVHHSNPDSTGKNNSAAGDGLIIFFPLRGGREDIAVPAVVGGHDGADFVIQRDLFDHVSDESKELKLVAGSEDAAISVAMGEAVWRSAVERRPINVADLLAGK